MGDNALLCNDPYKEGSIYLQYSYLLESGNFANRRLYFLVCRKWFVFMCISLNLMHFCHDNSLYKLL